MPHSLNPVRAIPWQRGRQTEAAGDIANERSRRFVESESEERVEDLVGRAR
jgi:hypothetical protein